MCCSRSHYPDEVGLHNFDQHYHIILPWSKTIAICVSGDLGNQIYVKWTNFNDDPYPKANDIHAILAPNDENVSLIQQKAKDILAIGIAEGGRLSQAWVKEILHKRFPEKIWIFNSNFPQDNFKIEPPEALEYHEWLAWQVMKEKTPQIKETI